jgi:GT2 family glycosyltransferase
MKWDVITVTFNSSGVLESNWSWYQEWSDQFNWIVVDNASQDNTVEIAESLGARVIRSSENLGFGAGCNLGLRSSELPLVLFANPDLRIQPEDLRVLEETLERESCLVSPQLLNLDGTLQINGRGKPYLSAKLAHRGLKVFRSRLKTYLPEPAESGISEVTWIMGACVSTKRETLEKIGSWDEKYFIYYEDHDLGMRANRLGVKVLVDSRLMWRHEWARATTSLNSFAWYHEFRSAIIFYRKYPELLR